MPTSSTIRALKEKDRPLTPRDMTAPVRTNGLVERLRTWGRSIWRRRWLSIVTAWLVCAAGWSVITLWPTSYVASAVIHADLAELTAQSGETGPTDRTPVGILRSLLLDDEVIGAVRTDTSLDAAKAASLRDDLTLRSTVPPVFVLTYGHHDPDIAKQVLEAVIAGFQAKRDSIRAASEESVAEIEKQIEDHELRIRFVDTDLATFKRSNADYLGDPVARTADLARLEEEVASLESALTSTTAERDSLATELAQARAPEPEEAAADASISEDELDAERERLEAELAKLRERYAETHPYVVGALDSLAALDARSEALAQASDAAEAELAAETDREALAQKHEELIAKVSRLTSRLAERHSEIELLEALTQTASSVEAELAELEADKESLTAALADLQQRRDQLGEGEAEEAQQRAFRLIKQPALPTEPVGPSRLMALAAVLVGGTGFGAFVALVCNRMKGVFESAWQLKRRFDVGVLGTISEVMTPAERKRLVYSRVAFSLACLALAGAFSGLALAEISNRLAPFGDQLRMQLLG